MWCISISWGYVCLLHFYIIYILLFLALPLVSLAPVGCPRAYDTQAIAAKEAVESIWHSIVRITTKSGFQHCTAIRAAAEYI